MKIILALALLLPAIAAAGETWFVGSVASYHYSGDDGKGYEQQNWGFGLEQRLTGNFAVAGGVYRNSNRRDSLYFGAAWTPIKILPYTRLGAAALLVGGYETTKDTELVKALFPVITIERDGFGLNIPIIPATNKNAGAIGLQLKWRF